jgi:hypothetical protein
MTLKSVVVGTCLCQFVIKLNLLFQVPHYLRTKPDPEVEARHAGYVQRAGTPSPETINKMILVLEKITRETLKIITREREELEHRCKSLI